VDEIPVPDSPSIGRSSIGIGSLSFYASGKTGRDARRPPIPNLLGVSSVRLGPMPRRGLWAYSGISPLLLSCSCGRQTIIECKAHSSRMEVVHERQYVELREVGRDP
jgi:hypothetical protein